MEIMKALFTGKGAIRRRLADLVATALLFAIFYIVTFVLLGI